MAKKPVEADVDKANNMMDSRFDSSPSSSWLPSEENFGTPQPMTDEGQWRALAFHMSDVAAGRSTFNVHMGS
jgi:hypothetical protein